MSEVLTLYGCPNTRSLRAAWALEEADAEYAYRTVDLFRGEGREPRFTRLNPGGKVPVLITPDGPLSESGAILAWIGERFPASGLLPAAADDGRRAQCLQWSLFALTELEQPLWTIAKHRFALPAEHRIAAIEPTAIWEFRRAAALLADRLQGRECLVDTFTMADILAAHCLAWAASARIDSGQTALDAYRDRHLARPAAQRAIAREGRIERNRPA
ncbi:MAG: glutathione S-transferase family protein [Rhodocyclaceae bacterium]|nr:glutathione S-transferase family protein [Rhodocyclaceae bacterium]